MKTRTHSLDEKEMELVKLLMAECKSTGDIQAKLKKILLSETTPEIAERVMGRKQFQDRQMLLFQL